MFDWIDDFNWLDIGIAGALGEELADEEKQQREIEKDYYDDSRIWPRDICYWIHHRNW